MLRQNTVVVAAQFQQLPVFIFIAQLIVEQIGTAEPNVVAQPKRRGPVLHCFAIAFGGKVMAMVLLVLLYQGNLNIGKAGLYLASILRVHLQQFVVPPIRL